MKGNMETFIQMDFVRRGSQMLAESGASAHDTVFINGLGRAFYWQSLIDSGVMKSCSDIARKEGLDPSTVSELMRLTLLSPSIIEMLIGGRQPRSLMLMWFQRNRLPVDWQEQRRIIDAF